MKKLPLILIIITSVIFFSCKKAADNTTTTGGSTSIDSTEVSQQVGDTMASLDEVGGSSGSLTFMKSNQKTFARLAPKSLERPLSLLLLPEAEATACSTGTFSTCTANTLTRNFGGCTIGSATFTGSISMVFQGSTASSCKLTTTADRLDMTPNYTVTGLRGATLTVSKTNSFGRSVMMISTNTPQFRYDNDGIRRKFDFNGTTLFDFTTTIPTSTPLHGYGMARSGRYLNGGTLVVTDNLTSKTCSYSPTNVTWDSSCTCAVSGTWSGSCTQNGATTTSSVALTGCGTGNVTVDGVTTGVTFDRCY